MNEIKRQDQQWARSASLHLARGEVADALSFYDQRNLIKSFDDSQQALERLVHDWADHAYDRPQHARILVATNDQVQLANELAQQKRIDKGVLSTKTSQTITDRVSSGAIYTNDVYLGDRVIFTKNDLKLNVLNGSVGTIARFKGHGLRQRPSLVVKLDNRDKPVEVPLSFEHVRLGYASTVHKAQGGTYEEAFVLLSGTSQNLPVSYVQGTRSRQATHFYTERALYDQIQDLKSSPLVAHMERAVDLSLAADLCVPHTATAATSTELEIQVLQHWQQTTLEKSESSLIVTSEPDVAASLNERCSRLHQQQAQVEWEQRRRQQSQVPSRAEDFAKIILNNKSLIVGDRIRFLRGSLGTGIVPNDFATVTQLHLKRNTVEVQLDRGRKVSMQIEDMPQFERGYAVTQQELSNSHHRVKNAYEVKTFWSRLSRYIDHRLHPEESHAEAHRHPAQSTPSASRATDQPSPAWQATDVYQWHDPQPFFGCTTTASLEPPQNTYTFQQTQQQHAAAAHQLQQMQQLNQATSWHAQQAQYLQTLGHAQQQSITSHQHGF